MTENTQACFDEMTECIICNCDLDEKGTGGIWDLADEICEAIMTNNKKDEQDTIYKIIRGYIENQKYCPNCGTKMEGAIHND